MWRNRKPGYMDAWILIPAVIAALAFMVTMLQGQSDGKLPVYTGGAEVGEVAADTEGPLENISWQVYADSNLPFSFSIPSTWTEVAQGDSTSFVDRENGASVKIETSPYDPSVNNASAESLAQQCVSNGYTYMNFTLKSNSQYELLYQDRQKNIYDYIEEVFWDRENVVKLTCTFNDADYGSLSAVYDEIISSFAWEREAPIPDGVYLAYIEYGDFEIGLPDGWATAVSGGAYVAMDEASGAIMSIRAAESQDSLAGITATDMVSLVQGGRESFMMKQFTSSETAAYSASSYVQGNVEWQDETYLFANGYYWYMVSFDYENGTIDSSLPSVCAGLFREFLSGKAVDYEMTDPEGTSSNPYYLQDGESFEDTGIYFPSEP